MTVWAEDAWAAEPSIPVPPSSSIPSLPAAAFDPRYSGALVWIAEIEAALDGGTLPEGGPAWADGSWGDIPPAFAGAGGGTIIRVSDLGWRSKDSDVGGAQPYPPILSGGPNIERRVALAPSANDTFAWGSLTLARPGVLPNTSLASRDTAMRRVRLRAGMQTFDSDRGIILDPTSAALVEAFAGMAMTWLPITDGAEIPLRDPSAWLDAPIQARKFLGTGGAEGPADLAGTPFPMVRGGSAASPVRNCPVVLVNAASRIYRWNDSGGALVALYEAGKQTYTNAGLVADVFAASPGAGTFVYDATGHLRLGSDPAGEITVDGAGQAGFVTAAAVIRELVMTTTGLPAGFLDESSITTTAAVAPWPGGWAWTGRETAREAIRPLLAALNARLVSSRSGGLRLWPLRAISGDAVPVASFDPGNAVSVTPVQLGAPLTPPTAVWSVGYGKTQALITAPNSTITAAERERLTKPWRTATWADLNNLTRYAQSSRPDLVETALLAPADATSLAHVLGALWGVPRQLYQVTMPTGAVLLRDIGDVVRLTWPADGLRSGARGQVVGDSVRGGQSTASLLVLV
ncbi:hypothetical protein [Sediminicoccus sp. KRV36]|uniref:hypothetical protein n=1 Tax=Sediminicoccus sp. KRV36 TaxID=3133721 RepID=UPI00201096EE|nr:hypothetical protein [Sediminicoccus rosea]UPY35492.1 hypothetical protein LHU95_14835 [Sediminicoccus rosea]